MKRNAAINRLSILAPAVWLCLTSPVSSADWDVQTVHAAIPDIYPVAPTLVGGPGGSLHLSYVLYGPTSNGLYHAEMPFGGSWLTSQVFADPNGLASVLANTVDSDGTPNIISFDYGQLRHSRRTGLAWTTEVIPNGGIASISPGRAAFNTADGSRFVFWDSTQGQLRMRWKDAAGWQSDLHAAMPQYMHV